MHCCEPGHWFAAPGAAQNWTAPGPVLQDVVHAVPAEKVNCSEGGQSGGGFGVDTLAIGLQQTPPPPDPAQFAALKQANANGVQLVPIGRHPTPGQQTGFCVLQCSIWGGLSFGQVGNWP
jgi:hypothetical protein